MPRRRLSVEAAGLDAYSRVVTRVAADLTPRVAGLQVAGRGDGRSRAGAGSGVVFTDDGLVLTNAHVVSGATGGRAAFADGTEAGFDLVGTDPLSDLAVVRVHGATPAPAPLGDADALVVGQLLVAVGFGLPAPLPAGLAARIGRREALRVMEVVPGSPAARAGIRPGDLTLTAAGRSATLRRCSGCCSPTRSAGRYRSPCTPQRGHGRRRRRTDGARRRPPTTTANCPHGHHRARRPAMTVRVARVCDEPRPPGGAFLVERLWPRGVREDALPVEGWLRDAAPSAELRRWYGHRVERFTEFRRHYPAELDQAPQTWRRLVDAARRGDVVLLHSARDREHNSARVLRERVERALTED